MLSGKQLKSYFYNDFDFDLYRYCDLPKGFDLESLIGKKYIILYPGVNPTTGTLTPNVGHYVALWGLRRADEQSDIIHFFDSYGGLPDSQVLGESGRAHYRKLIDTMYENRHRYEIHYNPYKFQKDDFSCGYWCGIRLKLNHLDDEEFKKFIDRSRVGPVDLYYLLKKL
jgi:hypothetical protein